MAFTVTFPTLQASSPSTKTLASIKKEIAAAVGGGDRPDEVGAGFAVDMALDRISEYSWSYYRAELAFTTTAGTAEYSLPNRTKDILDVRVTSGSERIIYPVRRDHYDYVRWSQTANSQFTHYLIQDLITSGSGTVKQIVLLPTPDAAESVLVKTYFDPAKPTVEGQAIEIPSWLERTLILHGQAYVMQRKGERTEKVGLTLQLAEDALRGALSRDRNISDEDVRLVAEREIGRRSWPWDHPNFGADDIW